MLFNSLEFFLFFPLVFAVYWGVFGRSLVWQNFFVVVASYVFYGWWDWRFLLLIGLTSAVAFISGVGLAWRRHWGWVAASVGINVGILGFFKYYDFFQMQVVELLQWMGFQAHTPTLAILLPVGISFYTFQSLSYTLDVWRGRLTATRDPVAFFAFVSFFPQLVAGPIERATHLLPQFLAPRRFDYAQAVVGCRQILWGFVKKVAVADTCAMVANRLLEAGGDCSTLSLAAAILCFTFQIYGDFSGYSDIAIGCGRLFGIRLSQNFRFPYFSRDIAEFWRRWHISLTTWFRDYVYIPLGGSRCGRWRAVRNTFVVFLVSGLWHGANWTFLAWGCFHACCFLPLLLAGANRRYLGPVAEGRVLPSVREVWQMGVTFLLAVLGWVFFRAPDVSVAMAWFHKILVGFDFRLAPFHTVGFWRVIPGVVLLMVCEWFNREEAFGCARLPARRWLRWGVYLALLGFLFFRLSAKQEFIYFQF